MTVIRSLPELSRVLKMYKNPYLLCHYKGIDWNSYVFYNHHYFKKLDISDELSLVSCLYGQEYKIQRNDFIKLLDGPLRIDGNNVCNILDDNKDYFLNRSCNVICQPKNLYSSFLHLKP